MTKKITKTTKTTKTTNDENTIASIVRQSNIANNGKFENVVNDAKKLTFTIAELSKRFNLCPKRSRRILRKIDEIDQLPCKRPKSKKWIFDIKYENAFMKLITK